MRSPRPPGGCPTAGVGGVGDEAPRPWLDHCDDRRGQHQNPPDLTHKRLETRGDQAPAARTPARYSWVPTPTSWKARILMPRVPKSAWAVSMVGVSWPRRKHTSMRARSAGSAIRYQAVVLN